MKIAILNTFYYPDEPGGAEKSVRILAESLLALGNEVHVICLGNSPESIKFNGVAINRMKIDNLYLPIGNSHKMWFERIAWHTIDSYNFWASNTLEKALAVIKPDVLHTNNLGGISVAAWTLAKRLGIPVVHTTRDFYLMCPQTTMLKGDISCKNVCAGCLPFSIPRKIVSKSISSVIGISKFILDRHISQGYFSDVRSSVIYNPFNARDSTYTSHGREVQLGFIGRLVPAKGIELLIDAFRIVLLSGVRARLLIAGVGLPEYENSLRQTAATMPIDFLGHVEPDSFFPSIDLTVVPSIWQEPLGRVAIESIAFGRPVVVTPVGGLPELINRQYGAIASEVTADSLAEEIKNMISRVANEGQEIYHAAIAAATKFLPLEIAKQYNVVYKAASVRN